MSTPTTARNELYDTGATNMFRSKAINPIRDSVQPLQHELTVIAADEGLTATHTYLEEYNLIDTTKQMIITVIVAPLILPKMRPSMSVTSSYKLAKLGLGHHQEPFSDSLSIIVGKPCSRVEAAGCPASRDPQTVCLSGRS